MRFGNWLYLNTRHDAYHLYDDEMLFDLDADPYQQRNLIGQRSEVLNEGRTLLARWLADNLGNAARGRDPHDNVMAEGGPFHVRGQRSGYLQRLRETDRAALADRLEQKWGA